MNAGSVLQILDLLAEASVQVWLDGGWGVDALLGEQARAHDDLDIVLGSSDVSKLREVLLSAGFQVGSGGTERSFVLADDAGRLIDVHAVTFDRRVYGVFELPDGEEWPFPPSAFAGRGQIGGRAVHCLSAEAQVQCHGQAYDPTENDLRDMERLQHRFGVVLPLHLCRRNG